MSVLFSILKRAIGRVLSGAAPALRETPITNGSVVVLLATRNQQLAKELTHTYKNTIVEFLVVDSVKDLIFAIVEKKINLIILDFDIRGLEDWEILSVLKKVRPRVGVVVMSEDVSLGAREKLVKEGMIYQIQMPTESGNIHTIVESIINKMNH